MRWPPCIVQCLKISYFINWCVRHWSFLVWPNWEHWLIDDDHVSWQGRLTLAIDTSTCSSVLKVGEQQSNAEKQLVSVTLPIFHVSRIREQLLLNLFWDKHAFTTLHRTQISLPHTVNPSVYSSIHTCTNTLWKHKQNTYNTKVVTSFVTHFMPNFYHIAYIKLLKMWNVCYCTFITKSVMSEFHTTSDDVRKKRLF